MQENEVKNGLWFDVGIKRYTTNEVHNHKYETLWFDVGIKRYTMRSMLR